MTLSPQDTVLRRAAPDPEAVARRGRGAWTASTPVGVVTEADCRAVDRFTQLRAGDVTGPAERSAELLDGEPGSPAVTKGLQAAFDLLHESRRRGGTGGPGRPAGRACSARIGALRSTIYRPALDADGRLRVAAAIGINGDVAGQGAGAVRRRRGLPRRGHRARAPGADARGAAAGPLGAARRSRWWPATSSPPTGVRDLVEAGADVVKVGVGPGRDVHHPDDDGGRPAAVLRGAGVRRRRPRAGPARCGPTAACGTRATSRWRWPPAPAR